MMSAGLVPRVSIKPQDTIDTDVVAGSLPVGVAPKIVQAQKDLKNTINIFGLKLTPLEAGLGALGVGYVVYQIAKPKRKSNRYKK